MQYMYTRLIKSRGWTVIAACNHWGIRYDVWRRSCKNPKFKARYIDQCRGLEDKRNEK